MFESEFFRCDCSTEGITVAPDLDCAEFYFAYYNESMYNYKELSFFDRLKLALKILFIKKNPYEDMVILNEAETTRLVKYLREKLEILKQNQTQKTLL